MLPGKAASGSTGWMYFLGSGPPNGSVSSFQLLDDHGKPLEMPQTVPLGKAPAATFVPQDRRLQQKSARPTTARPACIYRPRAPSNIRNNERPRASELDLAFDASGSAKPMS